LVDGLGWLADLGFWLIWGVGDVFFLDALRTLWSLVGDL
jgi:hypothetical protein